MNHFDRIKIDFYRDRQPEFEAFKKGDIFWRMESTAKTWVTEYNFPAIQQKRVIKREFSAEKRPQLQAWAVNQRREHFRDPRVREAIALCFDFEWTQKNLFYGMYERSQSLFEKSNFLAVRETLAGRTCHHGAVSRTAAGGHLRRSALCRRPLMDRAATARTCAVLWNS